MKQNNKALDELKSITAKNRAIINQVETQEKKNKFDFKDNIFTIKSCDVDEDSDDINSRKMDYEITKSGNTKKGQVRYRVVYDDTKTYNDPWTFELRPTYKVEIFEGGDGLPKTLYDYCGGIVRAFNIKEVLQNPNKTTYALDGSLL